MTAPAAGLPRWLPALPRLSLPRVTRRGKQPHECPPDCEHPRMVGIVVIAPKERANQLLEDICAAAQAKEPDRTVSIRVGDIRNIQSTADQPANMPGPEQVQVQDVKKLKRRARRRALRYLGRRSGGALAYGVACYAVTTWFPASAALSAFVMLGAAYGFVTFR